MRTKHQRIIDLIFSIRAIYNASLKTRFTGVLMLQKIIFLCANKYRHNKYRVLNQSFYRWDYGPMSEEVYSDFGTLTELGLIEGDEEDTRLTEKGVALYKSIEEIFLEESDVVSVLDEVVDDVKNLNSLMKDVYSLDVYVEELDEIIPMDAVEEGMHILTPLWEDEAIEIYKLKNEWIETLELMLDPVANIEIRKSIEDLKNGRIQPLER